MAKHVSLIGMMGAGKSSVAPLVAARLKRPVIEVDELIVKQEGMKIGEIFMAKGEAYFRRVEREIITDLIKQPPAVLSLGGGAFLQEATRELLLAHTVVFYLSASEEVLCSRLQTSSVDRPLLSTTGTGITLQETVKELMKRRGDFYALAHYRVDTDYQSLDDVARAVVLLREAYE